MSMANTRVITNASVRSILISLAHSLSLLLFSRGNRTLYRGEEKWGKKERGRSVWAEQCSTRRSLVWKCSWTRGKDANERTWKTIGPTLSRPFLRRFPTVVFNALSPAAPVDALIAPHRTPSLPPRSPSLLARIVTPRARERSRIYRYV